MWRQFGTTQHWDISRADAGSGGCAPADSANQIASGAIQAGEVEQSNTLVPYDGGSFRHLLHSAVHAANKGTTGVFPFFGCKSVEGGVSRLNYPGVRLFILHRFYSGSIYGEP